MTLKNTLCAIVTALALAMPLNAADIELGAMHNQGKTNSIATFSQAYKTGKLNLRLKAEKIGNAPFDVQAIGAYPLAKGYSISAAEKINVDPSFEPVQYTTSAGIGKTIGSKADISLSEAVSIKVGSDKKSYLTLFGASYKLGSKAKLCGTAIVPQAAPTKPMFKATVMYGL